MALQDTFFDNRCLLEYMSMPGTPFHSGLAAFSRRALYGHAWTDGLVSLRSAALLHDSPFVNCVAVPIDPDTYPSLVNPVAAATPELQRVFSTQASVRLANRFVKLTVLYNVLWAGLNVVGCGSSAVRGLLRAEAVHSAETWLPASLEAQSNVSLGASLQSAMSLQSGQPIKPGQSVNGSPSQDVTVPSQGGAQRDAPPGGATSQSGAPAAAPRPIGAAQPPSEIRHMAPPETLEEQLAIMDSIATNFSTLSFERHYVYRLGVVNHFSIHQRWLEKPNDVIQHLCDTLLLP